MKFKEVVVQNFVSFSLFCNKFIFTFWTEIPLYDGEIMNLSEPLKIISNSHFLRL